VPLTGTPRPSLQSSPFKGKTHGPTLFFGPTGETEGMQAFVTECYPFSVSLGRVRYVGVPRKNGGN
jgi:hypothetical protein